MYAYFKVRSLPRPVFLLSSHRADEGAQKLDYHSTECIYAPTAYRGYARALVKDLEAVRPSAIVDLVRLSFLLLLLVKPS